MKFAKYLGLALLIILIDQSVKLLVHFNMPMGELGEIKILGDFFKLHYTLNPGMAFGVELGSAYGKLFLTGFRLLAMGGIVYWLYLLISQNAPTGLLICLSMILGGAVGNLVDSIFYGIWLNNAPFDAVSPWFHGQVIDMFYLDLWKGYLPNWFPVMGGEWYSLWPIFNVADASIFVGIFTILIFQNKFMAQAPKPVKSIQD
jgi:signal peptidase II